MKKTILFYYLILSLFISCNDNILKSEYKEINKEYYMGIDNQKSKDSILYIMISGLNNAFHLKPLESTLTENELRIYFVNSFCERFFYQSIRNDSIYNELFKCSTVRRNDSLFMNLKSAIKASSKINNYKLMNVDSLTNFSSLIRNDTISGVTDYGNFYLIQIKKENKIKYILVENLFENCEKNNETKFACKIIHKIKNDFSFNFYDSWQIAHDSAFKKK
jgi:hypothetical protein